MGTVASISAETIHGLVSVIIPTHNRSSLIGETLDSVFSQTYRPLQCIIVDDGSTDDTESVVQTRSQTAPPGIAVQYVRQSKEGAPAARNNGIRLSHGQYLQFLDSDDLLFPLKIAEQVAALAPQTNLGAIYSFSRAFYSGEPASCASRVYHDPPDKLLALLNPYFFLCSTESLLWRRETVLKLGGWNESLVRAQDWDYLVRYLAGHGSLACLRSPLSAFRIHAGRLTGQTHGTRRSADTQSVLTAYRNAYGLLREWSPRYLRALARRIWISGTHPVNLGEATVRKEHYELLVEVCVGCLAPWYVRKSMASLRGSDARGILPLRWFSQLEARLARLAAFRLPRPLR